MTISLINSKYNKLDKEIKEKNAREIAKYAVSLLKEKTKIEKINISFTIHERKYLIVNYTNSLDSYSFEVSELQKELKDEKANKMIEQMHRAEAFRNIVPQVNFTI